jgi:hypothetical protein
MLTELASQLTSQEVQDIGYASVFVEILDKMIWLCDHEKEGCKLCNKDVELRMLPRLLDSLKNTRIGQKKLNAEENYIAKRVLDLIRLPGNIGKTHDILIPKALVGGLIRSLFALDHSDLDHQLSPSDYIKRISSTSHTQATSPIDTGMLAAIIVKSGTHSHA